jgi:hypothetical protein
MVLTYTLRESADILAVWQGLLGQALHLLKILDYRFNNLGFLMK